MGHIEYKGIKIYYNFKLLFPGYRAIMLFGNIYYRGNKAQLQRYLDSNRGDIFVNHEMIHIALAESFKHNYWTFYPKYIWYWIKGLFKYGINKKAYYNIPFEREAYANEKNKEYLSGGVHWKNYK